MQYKRTIGQKLNMAKEKKINNSLASVVSSIVDAGPNISRGWVGGGGGVTQYDALVAMQVYG